MTFEDAMIEELNVVSEINGKVFPINAPRIDENNKPVTAPYVIFLSSYGMRDKTLNGYVTSKRVDVDLNVIARTYPEMKSLTGLIMDILVSFEQREIGTNGPVIKEFRYEPPTEHYEHLPKLYRCQILFEVFFEEVE